MKIVNILMAGGLFLLGMQASANTKMICTFEKNGKTMNLTLKNFGIASATYENIAFSGPYSLTDEPEGTRLTGYKKLNFQLRSTNSKTPPLEIHAGLVLRPSTFDNGFGWSYVRDTASNAINDSSLDCVSAEPLPKEVCTDPNGQYVVEIIGAGANTLFGIKQIDIYEFGALLIRDSGVGGEGLIGIPCHVDGAIVHGKFVKYGGCSSFGGTPNRTLVFGEKTLNLNNFTCKSGDQ
ncbi:MAG: hypothetical protein V4736_15325 [Bdellovibrionota bacterium]